jgi:hypothetical protein
MIEQPHRPADRTLTVLEIGQPDVETGRALVRSYRPVPVRPVEITRPVPPTVRESGPADVDLFRPAAQAIEAPAPDRSRSTDPSGFGFAGPARPRTPAASTAHRPARGPKRPTRAPHIAFAIAVPAAGAAGFLSVLLSTGLPMEILAYAAIGSFVLVKVGGPVRAVVAFLAALAAKIGPR